MITDFELSVPQTATVTKKWCTELITCLKEHFTEVKNGFDEVKNSITDLKSSMKLDISNLERTFHEQIKEIRQDVTEVKKLAEKNSVAIQKLETKYDDMKQECNNLKIQNYALKQQSNKQETYSRRKNIILRGVKETENESNELCERATRLFLQNNLHLAENTVDRMQFVRCHRLRPNKR